MRLFQPRNNHPNAIEERYLYSYLAVQLKNGLGGPGGGVALHKCFFLGLQMGLECVCIEKITAGEKA